jgi:FkbM family methyltransferase
MNLSFFLYRRLSRWITCQFQLFDDAKISLENKFEIASFKDVFCHPFYWQIFKYLSQPPKLIVDCGAHCGHFSILADTCIRSKFGTSDTEYILIEPNPYLLPILRKNVTDAGLHKRAQIHQGMLGCDTAQGELWIQPQNYLATSSQKTKGAKAHSIRTLYLSDILAGYSIDLMKIDIEGGEFGLVHNSLDILSKVNLIFMELHAGPLEQQKQLIDELATVGLEQATEPVQAHGQQLIIFQR